MLARSRKHLGSAIDAPGPATYAPWQGCAVPTDDFLVLRLMEIVVHADDLACSVGIATRRSARRCSSPCSLFSLRWLRRRGRDAVLRALSLHERSVGPGSAF